MNIFSLSLLFIKFGILCVGGGYMLVPFLSTELVDIHHIITRDEFLSLVSMAQVTPGPIGINSATWIGFIKYGIAGGIVTSFALILPGSVLAFLANRLIERWRSNILIQGFFRGAKPASLALMTQAVFVFAGLSILQGNIPWDLQGEFPGINTTELAIFIIVFGLQFMKKHKPGLLLIFAAAGLACAFLG